MPGDAPPQGTPPPPVVDAPPTNAPPAPATPPPYPAGAGAAEVGADFAPEPEAAPETEKGFAGLDLTFFTESPNSNHVTVVAPIVRASFPVGRFTLEPDIPFVYYDTNLGFALPGGSASSGDSGFLVGNLTFAAKYHAREKKADIYVGAGVALPTARLDQGDESALSKTVGYTGAFATRGLWNIWWYYPNALTLFVPAGIRYVDRPGIDVGAEVGAGVLINTGSGSSVSSDILGALQVGAHIGYASSFFETGLRVKGVRLPGDRNEDSFQSSLEPYVRGLFEHAFIGAGFLINLDKPAGPLLDTGSIWGFRVEGGARF